MARDQRCHSRGLLLSLVNWSLTCHPAPRHSSWVSEVKASLAAAEEAGNMDKPPLLLPVKRVLLREEKSKLTVAQTGDNLVKCHASKELLIWHREQRVLAVVLRKVVEDELRKVTEDPQNSQKKVIEVLQDSMSLTRPVL